MASIFNSSPESNLASAKRSLRRIRGTRFHRITTATDDIIAIIKGGEIIEKHIFHRAVRLTPRRPFCIDNTALYQ